MYSYQSKKGIAAQTEKKVINIIYMKEVWINSNALPTT